MDQDQLHYCLGLINKQQRTPEEEGELRLFMPTIIQDHQHALHEIHSLKRRIVDLEEKASTDGLTKLLNQTSFRMKLEAILNYDAEQDGEDSILFCDVDHFKRYNDTYGHTQGDKALKTFADAMKYVIRKQSDVLCRYGGEEFCALLPRTSAKDAFAKAEQLRSHVEKVIIPSAGVRVNPDDGYKHITVSVGVLPYEFSLYASLKDEHERRELDKVQQERVPFDLTTAVLAAADAALYKAKETRNKVVMYEPGMVSVRKK